VPQRLPFQQFHGNEGPAFVFADVVDRADVGVIQCGRGLRLALKTTEGLGITGYLVGQELEGDEPVEPGVFGLVNHTHTAAAQLLDDAVMRDGLADHGKWASREPGLIVVPAQCRSQTSWPRRIRKSWLGDG
jgi:hypothetical protein